MTANESETSAVSSARTSGADEELWLTYLNYDQPIQQAVRRLGALSAQNVDLFRELLLKDRDRRRVKEYEAESIRRLQGEAFVGDEELQRTLIVLNAEDPRFGEELKRRVAATGKPAQLDQTVAAIRSGGQVKAEPPPAPRPAPVVAKERAREAVIVPLRREPAVAAAPLRTPEIVPPRPKRSLALVGVVGAVVLVATAGLVFLVPKFVPGSNTADVRPAPMPPPAKPHAVASVAAPAPAPKPAAAAVDIPLPAQSEKGTDKEAEKGAGSSPPLRPASVQPDMPASASQPDVSPAPVVGTRYKIVRGDMLSDIALKVYGDASKFRLIQAANPNIRNKPDRILVDQVIFIPPDKR